MVAAARLIRGLVGLCVLLLASPAFAVLETVPSIWVKGTSVYASANAICVAQFATSTTKYTRNVLSGNAPARSVACYGINDGAATDSMYYSYAEGCPATYSQNMTVNKCTKVVGTCPPPTVLNVATNVCEPPLCPKAGEPLGPPGASVWESTSVSTGVCMDGCSGSGLAAAPSGGKFYVWGPFYSNGSTCNPSASPPAPQPLLPLEAGAPAPDPLKPGTCPGTVNGTAVVVPCGTATTTAPTTTTAPPTTSTAPATGALPPGTTETGGSTSCTGSMCTTTTTTTTTNPGGTSTTVPVTTTEPIGTFCQKNPGNAICRGQGIGPGNGGAEGEEEEEGPESTFGGSCASTSCTGDAVQCAIAQEQARRACQLFDDHTTESDIGQAAATGTDPANHPRNNLTTEVISLAGMISTLPLFGSSGQCPSNQSITIQGQVISLPFGTMCPYLQMLGAAFMAACYLAAAFIVFRRG